MNYIIGVDIGTTNCKAVAYDSGGNVLAQTNQGYGFLSPEAGYHEQDPRIIFSAVLDVLRRLLEMLNHAPPRGVAFSAAMHGLMAVGEAGEMLSPIITWADLRSADYARRLKASPEGAEIYYRTGTPIHPMSPLCKLMWMKNEQPLIFKKAVKFIGIKEYVFFRLFGEYIIDTSIASATGLFDIYTKTWNDKALETAGIDASKLSEPVDATYRITGLKKPYADIPGLPVDTPFIIGASDGCLAHLGSSAFHPNDVSLTIGTSGAVRVMGDKPLKDPQQRIFNYLLSGDIFISGGPVNNGGNVLQWYAAHIRQRPFTTPEAVDDFISEAMTAEAGSGGLVFLPYIHGERAPVWDADARGIYYGISAAHRAAHFMRASMEGVCFALKNILDSLEELNGPVRNLHASGGFIRSAPWVNMLAAVLDRDIHITHAEDASAAGAAMIGMKSLGMIGSLAEAASFFEEKEVYAPDKQEVTVYRSNYAVYNKLYHSFSTLK